MLLKLKPYVFALFLIVSNYMNLSITSPVDHWAAAKDSAVIVRRSG